MDAEFEKHCIFLKSVSFHLLIACTPNDYLPQRKEATPKCLDISIPGHGARNSDLWRI